MCRNSFQQLLITAAFTLCALSVIGLADAGPLNQRENARAVSLKAADDVINELDRGSTVLEAALNGQDASKWSATPPDFSALFDHIGKGLTLPPLPPAIKPGEDLPSDGAVARTTISSLVQDATRRRDLILVLAAEPAFGSYLQRKLTSVDDHLAELSNGFARLGHKLASSYVQVLGYGDVDGIVSTYKTVVADLRTRAQSHESESKKTDQRLRQGSRPLLSVVSSLLQKEGLRLRNEKRALDELVTSLATQAKANQAEYEDIDAALGKNNAAVNALFTKERNLEAAAVAAAKQAEATGLQADRDVANAARQDLKTFRQGLSGSLTQLGEEKTSILARRDKNATARAQLQKDATAALARYKTFEDQQTGHDADEGTLIEITF